MSGHSKWSKVKHQKETTDAIKGKLFTKLTKAIIIAVKSGQGNINPDTNFKLRLAIENAKNFNMPKENISRAIEKSIDRGEYGQLEENIYEALYGEIGFIIEAATDNNSRTVSDIKNILERNNAVMVSAGAVSYLFQRLGCITIDAKSITQSNFDKFIMETDVADFNQGSNFIDIYTLPQNLHAIKIEIDKYQVTILRIGLIYKPYNYIVPASQEKYEKINTLIKILKENDDIQHVYTNCKLKNEI